MTLAASMLKLANSPLFNWGQPIESLDKAVVRMGMSECRNLILAISMRSVFNHAAPETKGICADSVEPLFSHRLHLPPTQS